MDIAGSLLGRVRYYYPGYEISKDATTSEKGEKHPRKADDGGIDIEILPKSGTQSGNHLAVPDAIKFFVVTHIPQLFKGVLVY